MSDTIGPVLPSESKEISSEDEEKDIGPALPPGFYKNKADLIGPSLPSQISDRVKEDSYGPQLPQRPVRKESSSEEEDVGPKVPRHLQLNSEEEFGPVLPPGFSKSSAEKILGPQSPPGMKRQSSDDSDDEAVIGPLPPTLGEEQRSKDDIARDFEKRAKKMKDRLEGKESPGKLKREEWMTELPPVLQGTLGVGPRQFRARAIDIGDRSGWTDSPDDKVRKLKEKSERSKPTVEETDISHVAERDSRIEQQLNDFKGSSGEESLLALHEKKRKRKMKEEEKSGAANVRRPFDREVDLQSNRFDDAAKKRMIKKSADLSSRFSHAQTTGTFL